MRHGLQSESRSFMTSVHMFDHFGGQGLTKRCLRLSLMQVGKNNERTHVSDTEIPQAFCHTGDDAGERNLYPRLWTINNHAVNSFSQSVIGNTL